MSESKSYDPKLKDDYDYSLEAGGFRKFLWFCSGTDVQILNRCPHSERVKAEGIGGVILATAGLAFLSGFYAFYTVFGPKLNFALSQEQQQIDYFTALIALVCGVAWALVIFNLDRFIVTSTGHGDGTEKITKEELKSGLPRIVMAIFIGICLSAPLETRVFKSEIDSELEAKQIKQAERLDADASKTYQENKKKLERDLAYYDEIIQKRSNDIQALKTNVDQIGAEKRNESKGQRGNARGIGNIYKNLEADEMQAQGRLNSEGPALTKEIQELTLKRDLINKELDKELKKKNEAHIRNLREAANIDGLGNRIQIAHDLFPVSSIVLMLLLIIIEITPIFIKMMFVRGPYDLLVENQNRIVSAKYGIEEYPILESNSELSPQGVVEPKFHQARLISEYEISALATERELSKTAQEAFLEKTLKDIKKNPDKYFVEKD
jgi:hypothetical protein